MKGPPPIVSNALSIMLLASPRNRTLIRPDAAKNFAAGLLRISSIRAGASRNSSAFAVGGVSSTIRS